MCGIAGIVTTGGERVAREDLLALADALAHRGPDGQGVWLSRGGDAGLVHRRLAIIDTSDAGQQPMSSADGAFTIVFNGEIYNFLELRAELARLGSTFASDSDTEVVLEAWRHWGEAMLPRFNGMWALAILDHRSNTLFLARDRFGVKPLLITHGPRRFGFASEMRALRALRWVDETVDRETAERLLYDPFSIEGGERTLVRGVRRLPAGHLATVRNGRVDVRRWWHTLDHLPSPPVDPGERAERVRELLFDSVRLRLRSDVPIGTCLSGGFDSSAIACTMAHVASAGAQEREAADWRHAFIASFPGKSNDETPQALEAAAYAGVRPHIVEMSDDDALARIDTVLSDLDDVYIGLPTAPWQIYRELRRAGVVVSLDGHGADELMGAYRQQGDTIGFAARNLLSWASGFGPIATAAESAKAALLTARGLNFLRRYRLHAPAPLGTPFDADPLPAQWGALNRRLYRMFHATVLPTILRNFDRLSMAHGVEVRMPFMDWRVVTCVMALPAEAKSAEGQSKLVARQAMAGLMPESIRSQRRKVGFNSPMPEWLNGPLRGWVDAVLRRSDPLFDDIVDAKALRARVSALSNARSWTWGRAGRLWPYVHLKWFLGHRDGET